MRVRGGGEVGYSRAYTGGDLGGYGWVRSGGVMTLSRGVSVEVVSTPASSVELISWVWVKSALAVENSLSAVLMSLLVCTIYSINVLISGLLSKLAGGFLRNSASSESLLFAPELDANVTSLY